MTLRFYMDVHVPAAITEALRRRNIDVLTSQEDGTREAADESLLHRTVELNRVLFSQDLDLLRIADEWQSEEKPFPGIVFAHQRGTSIGQCVDDLQLIAECCYLHEVANKVIFVPLT